MASGRPWSTTAEPALRLASHPLGSAGRGVPPRTGRRLPPDTAGADGPVPLHARGSGRPRAAPCLPPRLQRSGRRRPPGRVPPADDGRPGRAQAGRMPTGRGHGGGDDAGRVGISSREPAYKVRNLRADPRAVLCAFRDEFFGPWVRLSGPAEIIALPEAMPGLEDLYRQVAGEHPDWDDYRAAMVRDRRVLIAISPESAGPDREA